MLDLFTNMDSGLSVTDSQSGFRAFAWQTRNVVLGKQRGTIGWAWSKSCEFCRRSPSNL
ncbi:MAG: hypothetical protein WCW68_11180 [Methanothrix sp.]